MTNGQIKSAGKTRVFQRRYGWLLAIMLLYWISAAGRAEESGNTQAAARLFGLDIPAGDVTTGRGGRVLVADDAGQAVVAMVHVTVGDQRIVRMPDGRLTTRPSRETTPTDRPFQPASKTEIAEAVRHETQIDFHIKETRRYLYLYHCSDRFVEVTSRILETMFAGVATYVQAQGIETRSPEVPLTVLIFRTPREFSDYRRMPEGTVAYYEVLSNRIVMYEQSPLWTVNPELAIQQTVATIAHEGAHQILANIGVQHRLAVWPMWLNEGLAEFFAPTTTDRYLKWKGAGQVNDLRMFELEQYLKRRTVSDADGQLVAQTVGAAQLTSTGYAAAWALTHHLAQNHREAFHALVRDMSRLGPLEGRHRVVAPGGVPDNVRIFKQHFGNDLAEMERQLFLHLNKQPYVDPFADWPHYAVVVAVPDGRKGHREANVFYSSQQAEQWLQERIEPLSAEQRETVQSTIREFPNRAIAETFARQWLNNGS